METTSDSTGYIIWIISVAFIVFTVYYCNKVAKDLKMSQTVAVLAGLLFAIPALLIYSHLAYRAKKKLEAESL